MRFGILSMELIFISCPCPKSVDEFSWQKALANERAEGEWGQGIYFFFSLPAGLKGWQWLCTSVWGCSTWPVRRLLTHSYSSLQVLPALFPFKAWKVELHPTIVRPSWLPLICSLNSNHIFINSPINKLFSITSLSMLSSVRPLLK